MALLGQNLAKTIFLAQYYLLFVVINNIKSNLFYLLSTVINSFAQVIHNSSYFLVVVDVDSD